MKWDGRARFVTFEVRTYHVFQRRAGITIINDAIVCNQHFIHTPVGAISVVLMNGYESDRIENCHFLYVEVEQYI